MRFFQAKGLFLFVVKPLGLYSFKVNTAALSASTRHPDSSGSVIHSLKYSGFWLLTSPIPGTWVV